MRAIRRARQFKKDVRRAGKRRKDLEKLKQVIELLAAGKPLAAKYRDHALGGAYRGTCLSRYPGLPHRAGLGADL